MVNEQSWSPAADGPDSYRRGPAVIGAESDVAPLLPKFPGSPLRARAGRGEIAAASFAVGPLHYLVFSRDESPTSPASAPELVAISARFVAF